MIHVYLDDYRKCPKGFLLARNAEECKQMLDSEHIDILSLDYDLGWGQPTGFEVVRHLIEARKYPRRIYLHTSSTSGRIQMYQYLSTHLPDGVDLHGGPMPQSILEQVSSASGTA